MSSSRKWMVAVVVGLVCVLALYYGVLSGGGADPGADGSMLASDPTLVDGANKDADEPKRLAMGGDADNQPGILSESISSKTGATSTLDADSTLGPYDVIGSETHADPIPLSHDANDSLVRELPSSTTRPVVHPDPGKGDITVPAKNNPPIVDPTKPAAGSTPIVKPNTPATTPPAANVPPKTESYTVKEGDTMSSIASQWFGDGLKWDLIAKSNPLIDPNKMQIGQKLNLPAKSAERDKPKVSANEYIVRPGDTLVDIARAVYGDGGRWKSIYNANKKTIGSDPDHVTVGMKLSIPSARS